MNAEYRRALRAVIDFRRRMLLAANPAPHRCSECGRELGGPQGTLDYGTIGCKKCASNRSDRRKSARRQAARA